VLGARLAELGIQTVAQLSRAEPARLREAAGNRTSELLLLAKGVDPRPVEADRAPKSYGEENTFESDVDDPIRVKSALTAHAEAVAQRLRRDGYAGRTVTLKVKLGRARGRRATRDGESEPIYPLLSRSKTLPEASASGRVLRDVAVALWDEASISEPVRLLGISVANLTRSETAQLDLFAKSREDKLGPALDAITQRFGSGSITRAVKAPEKLTPTSRRKRGSD
jgi:DNA polymerase-4